MKRGLPRSAAALAFALVVAAPSGAARAADALASGDPDASAPNDPWEPFNRPVFVFNDFLSEHALEPVGRGWKWLVPRVVRESISRVFQNVRTPAVMVNDLLQGKPRAAGVDLAHFLMNSTVGLAGILDPAAAIGLAPNREDFGQTFGVWGIPPGPYLVLPFLGPSSPRDAVGSAADAASRGWGWFIPIWAGASLTGIETLNEVSFFAEDVAAEREAAFDWYAAVRNAHVSRRENLVRDLAEAPPEASEDEDDLYFLEEEDDEGEGAADPGPAAEEAQP